MSTLTDADAGLAAAVNLVSEDAPTEPKFWTVAVYLVGLRYGGPEEGGWWYDAGVRSNAPIEAAGEFGAPRIFTDEREANGWSQQQDDRLNETINRGRPPKHSVASDGIYESHVYEGWPPATFPLQRPQYE